MYYTDSYNFTTRVIVVLIIKMGDLQIFENNKIKYSLHFAAVSLPASMVIAKFWAIHGGNTRQLMCSEFNIVTAQPSQAKPSQSQQSSSQAKA